MSLSRGCRGCWRAAVAPNGRPLTRFVWHPRRKLCPRAAGDLWDSGKVASDDTIHIRYAGAELKSSQEVVFCSSYASAIATTRRPAGALPASWTMGLLSRKTGRANGSARRRKRSAADAEGVHR